MPYYGSERDYPAPASHGKVNETAKQRRSAALEKPPTWPDGTVRLPDALESWLDGHFAGEKGDDDDLDAARNVAAVAFWSLIYRQGDPETDQAALDVLAAAVKP